jgi:plastocyanin
MSRRTLLLAAVLLAALGAQLASAMPAADHGSRVSIGYDTYAPPAIDVLVGDTVTWGNDSVRPHTVTADDGTWASGRMVTDEVYAHRFDAPGTSTYYCQLHAMTGAVRAWTLLLHDPTQAAAPGRPFPIEGRAAVQAGSTVAIEADAGGGYVPAATATVMPDGTFTAQVTPTTTAYYHAVAGDSVSPPVQLVVVDHQVAIAVTRHGRRTDVAATVMPPAPGATVVLQLRLRDRFGWWPVQVARLDRSSRARFSVRRGHAVPGRVRLTLADGATALAESRTVPVGPIAR